tara:strand:- start:1479 stop:2360 length:882 start_codon:yes stop_codon:yes gene_type:complete
MDFVRQKLIPEPTFKGFVVTDSVAQGEAYKGSDVDAIIVFDPLCPEVIPGDFLWHPDEPGYLSRNERALDEMDDGWLHIDGNRVDIEQYRAGKCEEIWKFQLTEGILLFDRDGDVEPVIDRLIEYSDQTRRQRIASNLYHFSYHLNPEKAMRWYRRSGSLAAHCHVSAGINYMVKMLYAYNRRWLTWPNKRVPTLLSWPDPVGRLEETLIEAQAVHEYSPGELFNRIRVLTDFRDRFIALAQSQELLPAEDPLGYAFGVEWPQIGMRHTMSEWRKAHKLYKKRVGRHGTDDER